jgi:hypothetical protein
MKCCFILLFGFCILFVCAQGYTRVEYFVDIDPGFGKAKATSLPKGDDIQFIADLSTIGNGIHSLYFRVQDGLGHWSQTTNRLFIKQAVPRDATITIAKAEYYVDTDPGFGKATAISSISGETIDAIVDLSTIKSGLHNLNIRTFDTQGHWSQVVSRSFIKNNFTIANPNIVAAEYFIDSVGDFGKGKSVDIATQSQNMTINTLADLNGLSVGIHAFYLRAKDTNGQWSMIQNIPFQVIKNTAIIHLTDTEKLILYPNPASNNLHIKGFVGEAIVSLYNSNGNLLLKKGFVDSETISVSTLPNGLYILKIRSSQGEVEKKFVKN